MKIYTRKGDGGETSLFGGKQVPKDNVRVVAYGNVDELNSAFGKAASELPTALTKEWRARLASIQSDCFTIGAMLATPKTGEAKPEHIPSLAAGRVAELEGWIDELDRDLEPLKSFILPGGTPAAASLHVARCVCRRAERSVVTLSRDEDVEPQIVVFLNRLSDFLFTLARAANAAEGAPDLEWKPKR